MRLSTRMHGIVDHGLGVLLILLPWALSFGATLAGAAAALFGIALIANSLVTNFETGRARIVEIPVHLWLDGVIGLLLIISPWIAGFDRTAWIPHAIGGLLVIGSALITNTIPEKDRRSGATPDFG